nr:MAG TPA: hypothetical protein [Caudoviricetes sp.]
MLVLLSLLIPKVIRNIRNSMKALKNKQLRKLLKQKMLQKLRIKKF